MKGYARAILEAIYGPDISVDPALAETSAPEVTPKAIDPTSFKCRFDESLDELIWEASPSRRANQLVKNGALSLNTNSTNSCYRALILSKSKAFNPFAKALSFTFTGIGLEGVPDNGSQNVFYIVVGSSDPDDIQRYNPATFVTSGKGNALVLTIEHALSGDAIEVIDIGAGRAVSVKYPISGIPSEISWSIDGTVSPKVYSVELSGAKFKTGSNILKAEFSKFSSGKDSPTASKVAIGAFNGTSNGNSPVNEATQITLESISITEWTQK